MGPSRARNSTRRATKARSVKPTPTPRHKPTLSPAAMKKRLESRKPVAGLGTAATAGPSTRRKPADDEADLFAILHELANAISVIRTAKQSLEHRDSNWDEIVTLEAAIKQLRRVDVALNDVADGRPARITPDEVGTDDDDIDTEGAE
jgi:hypothetical protein